jgi:hypothetical protein
MVGTDKKRGWVRKSDRGSDLKGAEYGRFNRNPPYIGFPAAADLISMPLGRAATLAAVDIRLMMLGSYPLGWVYSTS